jgi:hypothetical protein
MPAQTTRVRTSGTPGHWTWSAGQTTDPLIFSRGRTASPAPAPATPVAAMPAIRTLSYGELAVAIHAAGIPRNYRALTVDQVWDLVARGVALLGLDEIKRRRLESQATTLRMLRLHDAGCDYASETAELDRLWTSGRLEGDAHNLAYRIVSKPSRLAVRDEVVTDRNVTVLGCGDPE